MRLAGAICCGSGTVNEDGMGWCGNGSDVSAAFVFDGVTGINGRSYLGAASDAGWLVSRASRHLVDLAVRDLPLPDIISALVDRLVADWGTVKADLPADYDPPAACLILVKRYSAGWQGVRLGDSCLLAEGLPGSHHIIAASPNNNFDHWLAREAHKRREKGVLDTKVLLAEFRPQLLAARQSRNRPGGYGILEAAEAAKLHADYADLGSPRRILLCTDGFYRAVDHYNLFGETELLEKSSSPGGVQSVLAAVRDAEARDPDCLAWPRFKPADDAAAVALAA